VSPDEPAGTDCHASDGARMTAPDVVVVGGGIIGAACAYEIACTEWNVLVIERRPGCGGECTSANAGLGRSDSAVRIVPHRSLTGWLARIHSLRGALGLSVAGAPYFMRSR
jgi:glycine/D-amino acid oxidase-like deaminating enzyme